MRGWAMVNRRGVQNSGCCGEGEGESGGSSDVW